MADGSKIQAVYIYRGRGPWPTSTSPEEEQRIVRCVADAYVEGVLRESFGATVGPTSHKSPLELVNLLHAAGVDDPINHGPLTAVFAVDGLLGRLPQGQLETLDLMMKTVAMERVFPPIETTKALA